MLRSIGLEGPVRAASGEQFDPDGGINAVESLAGREIASYIANLNEGVAAISPSTRLFMTQQSLEPLIRTRAGNWAQACAMPPNWFRSSRTRTASPRTSAMS